MIHQCQRACLEAWAPSPISHGGNSFEVALKIWVEVHSALQRTSDTSELYLPDLSASLKAIEPKMRYQMEWQLDVLPEPFLPEVPAPKPWPLDALALQPSQLPSTRTCVCQMTIGRQIPSFEHPNATCWIRTTTRSSITIEAWTACTSIERACNAYVRPLPWLRVDLR
jgi:hypothetical protein